ncbi:hypothetical protein HAX54_002071 [Datura stramonium]|uniref:Uncharacterized protein n=1 Tax=Datura stramonium TaxID=4076 RepID=A0ABS8T5H1_DATST|nr:hypothetical protein [Datura stramonium]
MESMAESMAHEILDEPWSEPSLIAGTRLTDEVHGTVSSLVDSLSKQSWKLRRNVPRSLKFFNKRLDEGGEASNAVGSSKSGNEDSTTKKLDDSGKESLSGNEIEATTEIPSLEEMQQMEIRGESTHHKEYLRWKIEDMREI